MTQSGNLNMNLIKMNSNDDRIKDFFVYHISALHKNMKGQTSCYLDLGFKQDKQSYFTSPLYPQHMNISSLPIESERQLADYLNELWREDPKLLDLIPDLIRLAFILKEQYREQTGELSPFVYAMF